MSSVDTYQKRLRDELSAVEKGIQSHNQQIEALNKRLGGLKRAVELFESEQTAIVELLRTSIPDGDGLARPMINASVPAAQKTVPGHRAMPPRTRTRRITHNGRGETKTQARPTADKASQNGGLKRIDMIAAVLKRRSGLSVRDLIAALGKEFGWKCTESNLTGHLYTNPKFAHTKGDRSANRPVIWSLR
jgi:hypothetical protein